MKWRVIKEFPEYEVSDTGLIRCNHIPTDGRRSCFIGHITAGSITPLGYKAVMLRKPGAKNKKPYRRTIHRLVALAFIPNPKRLRDVAHNDGDPSNNRVSNLRWATHRDNQMDMRKHGTMQDGAKCCTAKLTEAQVKEIYRRSQKRGQGVVLTREFGISKGQVSRIKTGHRWAYLGKPVQTNPRKLTAADVRFIRRSPQTGITLAVRYGVDAATIYAIRRRITWKWL